MATVYIVLLLALLAVVLIVYVARRPSNKQFAHRDMKEPSVRTSSDSTSTLSKEVDLPPLEYPRSEPRTTKRG